MRLTDVADTEQVLRLIQSIPSKKAEPFKQWLAKVGSEHIDEAVDPEVSINRAIHNYRRLGTDFLRRIRRHARQARTCEDYRRVNPIL